MVSATSTASTSELKGTNTPVLIVGAGPTGIFAALLLTKMGVPCRLIERHREISKLSKALAIHARSLEMFNMVSRGAFQNEVDLGEYSGDNRDTLLGKLILDGLNLSDFHIYFGEKLYSVLPMFRNTESRFDISAFIEQSRTVEILTEEYEKLGGRIDRGWELMDTRVVEEQDATGENKSWVETTIRRSRVGTNIRTTESRILGAVELEADQEGKEYDLEVVRSEYLIAADGGKSAVRHKLNIAFPGLTRDNNMILFDGRVKTNIPVDNVVFVHGDSGRAVVMFPLGNNRVRMMLNNGMLSPEEHEAQKSEELTLSKFQEMVDATSFPVKIELLDCDWLTYYRVNERLADQYSHKGRIFLAGDAAHVHSPAGGQGLNLGLQDAYNLTWKISLVLKGSAPASIVDTYEPERRKVAEDIIKLSSHLLRNMLADTFFRRTLRKVMFKAMPYILPYIPQGPPTCMLRIRYHENGINKSHITQAALGHEYEVGVRARDGYLTIAGDKIPSNGAVALQDDQVVFRLHDLLVGPGTFHIVVFTSDMLSKTKTAAAAIKGIRTTTAYDIAKNTDNCLAHWRAKWQPESSTSKKQERLFMVHIISAQTTLDMDKSSVLKSKAIGEGKLFLDDEADTLHQRYGVAHKGGVGSIVVLRPDSYVGFRVQGAGDSAWEDVNDYLNSILVSFAEPKL